MVECSLGQQPANGSDNADTTEVTRIKTAEMLTIDELDLSPSLGAVRLTSHWRALRRDAQQVL